MPHETGYSASPPSVYVELLALELSAPAGAVPATPLAELIPTPSTTTDAGKAPEIISYPASIRFSVSVEGRDDEEVTYPLTYDISFVTAHPCAPSHRVRMLKSPSSPTIQKIDVSGSAMLQGSRSVNKMGKARDDDNFLPRLTAARPPPAQVLQLYRHPHLGTPAEAADDAI